jgi:hypothetical protein
MYLVTCIVFATLDDKWGKQNEGAQNDSRLDLGVGGGSSDH